MIKTVAIMPVDKQNLMAKEKIIKEGTEWSAYPGIKEEKI